jgi:DHA1 family tetracycline resistance protein-like MFS transporter
MGNPTTTDDTGRFPPALIALLSVVFINMVGFGVVVPLLPFFARSMQAPEWQVTLMFAAYSLGQFVGEPFWGRLSDRLGRKPVLLMTLVANVFGYLALAFAPDIWIAILVRLFTGFGAGNISTVQAYIADVTPPHRRTARMGLIGAAFGLGFIVGPGLGGLLTDADQGRLGFQIPLFVAAAMSAIAAIGVMTLVNESRTHAPTPQPPWTALGDAVRSPIISRLLLVSLIYMAGFSGMEATFGLWAEDRYGWGARQVGWCFMAVGIVSAVCQGLVTGRLARRFGEIPMLTLGVLTFGACLALQTVNTAELMVPVLMAVGAFGMSMAMPNIAAVISQSSPAGRQGSMLGLNMAAGSGARVFGPLVAGFVYSAFGHNWPFWLGAAMTVPAAIVAINAGRVRLANRDVQGEAAAG